MKMTANSRIEFLANGLAITILLCTVTGVQSQCDANIARNCLNGISAPTSEADCPTALATFHDVVVCSQDCTETDIVNDLSSLKSAISTHCGDPTICPDLGGKWSPYHQCLDDNDIDSIISDVVSAWNLANYGPMVGTERCINLLRLHTCLATTSTDCDILRERYGELFVSRPTLKQVSDICGKEVTRTATVGPIITECDRDVDVVIAELQTTCPLDFDYSATGATIVGACGAMQRQINCALQYQSTCPLAVARFLSPRMQAYAPANEKFCANVTMNALVLKHIKLADQICDYESTFACFKTITKPFGFNTGTFTNGLHLLNFLQFNEYGTDLKGQCENMFMFNATRTLLCVDQLSTKCTIPFPTFGFTPFPRDSVDTFEPSLYNLLSPGPIPVDKFGAKFIADQRYFICYPECSNYEQLEFNMTDDCLPALTNATATVNAITSGSVPDDDCASLEDAVECVADVSVACPLFYDTALAALEQQSVMTAMTACDLDIPTLRTADFVTVRTTVITTTKDIPPSTSALPPSNDPNSTPATSPNGQSSTGTTDSSTSSTTSEATTSSSSTTSTTSSTTSTSTSSSPSASSSGPTNGLTTSNPAGSVSNSADIPGHTSLVVTLASLWISLCLIMTCR